MNFKKALASALSLVMLTSLLVPPTTASAADIYTASSYADSAALKLSQTLTYSENTKVTSSGSYRQDFIFEYTPGTGVAPVVAYGDTIYGRTSIEEVAAKLQAEGHTILAGVNADYFSMTSGVPEGLTVTDGVLRCSDSYQTAVGIRADGSVFIGKPQLKITLTSNTGYTVPVTYINKVRTSQGVYLLNSDYQSETGFSRSGTTILLRKLTGDEITIGGTVQMVVERISTGNESFEIPEDCMVLTVSADGPTEQIAAVQVGHTLTLSVTSADSRWNQVQYACGAGDVLIENGTVASGLQTSTKPRTVLGVKSDGSVIVMAIDGSQSRYSVGTSLSEIASELLSMGCVSAVNLDGGGSTTAVVTYPGNTQLALANSPSGGEARSCSTYLFFVNTAMRTGIASALYLYPYNAAVLTGAQITYETKAVDTGYYASSAPSSVSYTTGAGTFFGSVFTAGSAAGTYDVFASAGALGANGKITVIDDTNRITVTRKDKGSTVSTLSVSPGETVDLDAYAYYLNRRAYGSDTSFVWSVSDNIGQISADGVFTAATVKGLTGNIAVSYGSKTVTIPVTVGRAPVTLDTFDSLSKWDSKTGTLVSDYSKIKYGTGAVSFAYDLTEAPLSDENLKYVEIIPKQTIYLSNAPDYLNLWIYADGSGNLISVNVTNSDNQTLSSEEQYAMDTIGWKHMTFSIPAASKFHSIVITSGGKTETGTIIADQLAASYAEPLSAESKLSVSFASVDVGSLVAFVTDASGNSVKTADIQLLIDGDPMTFTYDMASGLLLASYTLDTNAHRITLIAKDSAGNLARVSQDVAAAAAAETGFADLSGHWAKSYADFLSMTGVITGVETDGKFYFNPSNQTTRTEMAVIIARYLGLDPTKYASVELPFSDNGKIAAWALPYIKAVYAEGLMSGTTINGVLCFNPTAPLTRAEALTILGRTLPQGYAITVLGYADADQIASWALPHFEKLVALGIVGGYTDNTIKPTNLITRAEVATLLYRLY